MQIFVASIEHSEGTNLYAARSATELQRQLAIYCREEWSAIGLDGDPTTMRDKDVIDDYFEAMEGEESYHIETVDLED